MNAPTRHERHPRIWLTVAILLAGLLAFHFTRGGSGRAPSGRIAAHEATVAYRNRALLPRPATRAPREPERQPAIRGAVYDTSGKLLVGATVIAATFDTAGNVPSIVGSSKSDDQGRFEVALPEGTYQLNATLDGYGPAATAAQSGETVSLVLGQSGSIRGHARDPQGRPVRRFTVDVVSMAPGDAPAPPPLWSRAFDSADGSFRVDQLPTWPIILRVMADGYAPALSPPISVPAQVEREVNLTLDGGCVLEGTVQDKDGAPMPGVLVNAEERLTVGSISDPMVQVASQSQSDAAGGFRIEHVPRGTVIVRGYDGENAVTTMTVEIAACAAVTPVKLVMSPGGAIVGVARRADGAPLPGARVTVLDRAIGIVNTRSDGRGNFRFDNLPAGMVRLELEHEGQSASQFVSIAEGGTSTQDIVLFARGNGEIRGQVVSGSKPIASARLFVASSHEGGIAIYFAVTGEDGTFRVPEVAEGAYVVNVMSTVLSRAVRVEAGQATNVSLDISFTPATKDSNARAPRRRAASQAEEPSP